MKYVTSFAFVVSLGMVSACGGSDSPAMPATPSGSGTQTFTAALRPSEETPPITGPASAGRGTATLTMNTTHDPSASHTSATATFVVNLSGFPAGTPINMAHIHQAAAGQSGNVVVSTTLSPGDVTLNGGGGSFNRSGIAVTPDIASQLMTNPAGFYFNVHSTLNPGGVARGQLVRVQ